MADEKITKITSLKRRHTRVLHYFFRGVDFTVSEICKDFDRNEKTIRGYLTDIYEILGVPDDTNDNEKREWVVREYSDAYEYVFKRGEWDKKHPPKKPEIFISAPAPKVVAPIPNPVAPTPVKTPTQAPTPPMVGYEPTVERTHTTTKTTGSEPFTIRLSSILKDVGCMLIAFIPVAIAAPIFYYLQGGIGIENGLNINEMTVLLFVLVLIVAIFINHRND